MHQPEIRWNLSSAGSMIIVVIASSMAAFISRFVDTFTALWKLNYFQ